MTISSTQLREFLSIEFPDECLATTLCPLSTQWKEMVALDLSTFGSTTFNPTKLSLLADLIGQLNPRPTSVDDELTLRKIEFHFRFAVKKYVQVVGTQKEGSAMGFRFVDRRRLEPSDYVFKQLLDILQRCPDRAIPTGTEAFGVVKAKSYRRLLLEDLNEVEVALGSGSWKSATVMAGSLIEALLFYRLDVERSAANPSRVTAFMKFRIIDRQTKLPKDLEKLALAELALFSSKLNIISKEERARIDQIGDFRNLVHPGKSHRLKERCDRATAYLAYSALLMLDRNLRKA